MNIAVAGIGGVGGYIGAKLCGGDDFVTFVVRGSHADAIRKSGITVVEDDADWKALPDAVVSAEACTGVFDLLLLCVKSYDIAEAVKALKKNIASHTVIIPFANGVEHTETVAGLVDAKVLHGAVYILAHRQADGVVRKEGNVFAAVFGHQAFPEATRMAAGVFEAAGLRYKTPAKIEEALWKKYLFISAFAMLTSHDDMSIRRVAETHGKRSLAVLEEIAAVAAAKGIEVSDEVGKAMKTALSLPEDASTSMHLDRRKGRRTELETLGGYLVREARHLGVAVPETARLFRALKALE